MQFTVSNKAGLCLHHGAVLVKSVDTERSAGPSAHSPPCVGGASRGLAHVRVRCVPGPAPGREQGGDSSAQWSLSAGREPDAEREL